MAAKYIVGLTAGAHTCRGRQKNLFIDFEKLGAVPKDKLRQAKPASICLKTAPSKADTLLPKDHHYQVSRLHQMRPFIHA